MRQASKRIPESAEKTVGIFAEPHAGIIPLKRRSASCWKACVARTALLSCAARKGSIRTCTTVGRRSSWRRARNGSPATRRVRPPRTRSRSSRLKRPSYARPCQFKSTSGQRRDLHYSNGPAGKAIKQELGGDVLHKQGRSKRRKRRGR